MKKRRILVLVFVVLTVGFFACQKDDLNSSDATGPSTLGVKIQALNKSFSLPVVTGGTKSASVESSSIVWDSVQMIVSSIKLEAELKSLVTHRDSIEISYKWTGPQVANLLYSTTTFGNFILQPGFYDEIEMVVKGSKSDAGDQPVFYQSGMYTTGTSSVRLKVMVYEDVTFKTEKDSIEVTEENIDITSYIQLYLNELMADVDPSNLDNATLTDGVIIISAESNRAIYYTIMHNLVKKHHHKFKHKHHNKYNNHGDDDDHEGDHDDDHDDDHEGDD